jgi:nitrous oxidase accessory protein
MQIKTIFLLFVLCFALTVFPEDSVATAQSNTIIVPDDYLSISDAVGNSSEGDTIYIKNGTYLEHTIVVDKSLSLVGENVNTTIIQNIDPYTYDFIGLPPPIASTIKIVADNVTVSGLTITKPAFSSSGHISGTGDRIQITGNIIECGGIFLSGAYQQITQNTIAVYQSGIECTGSYNKVNENRVNGSGGGIQVGGSFNTISLNNISTASSSQSAMGVSGNLNTITGNNLMNGMVLEGSNNSVYSNEILSGIALRGYSNTIVENQFSGVSLGTRIDGASNNIFYHNNILAEEPVYIGEGVQGLNFWDNCEEGNYWSEYNGTDTNNDGIGDTSYFLDANNNDNYPLMNPVEITTISEFSSFVILIFVCVIFVGFFNRKLCNRGVGT